MEETKHKRDKIQEVISYIEVFTIHRESTVSPSGVYDKTQL